MKKILTPIFVFAFAITSAQQKSQLSLSIGISQPISNFAKKDTASNVGLPWLSTSASGSGLAKTGFNISLGYKYFLNQKWGLAIKLRGQQNAVDGNFVKQKYDSYGYGNAVVEADSWLSGSILAGGLYRCLLNAEKRKLELQINVMAGALKTGFPGNNIVVYELNNPQIVREKGKRDYESLNWAFAWLAGTELQYHLTKKLKLTGALEYTTAYLKKTYPLFQPSGQPTLRSATVKNNMGTISLNFGVAISL